MEELAGVLLIHLNSYEGVSGNSIYQNGGISRHNFFNSLTPNNAREQPEYGDKQPQVNQALMEAWAWLQSAGLLVEKASSTGGWFFVSRRGKQITSRDDFAAYRKAGLLPKSQLHPLIASKVYPAFMRGEYDTAVFQAFREVEVAVRTAGKFGPNDYGTDLMRDAFRPAEKKGQSVKPGPLTDTQLPTAEQEAMANLFAGAIGLYKNPQSHRHVPTQAEDAAEVIVFASQLLRIVDSLKL
ncbi:MAG: TIGR02391 family protein [Bryobacteraceae bacterium]